MDIGVVIPTRNRAAFLERCLESLCKQTLDPSRYEICVANNGSTDDTPRIVASVAARYPKHTIILADEPETGVARARNKGFHATTAPLVCMGDDDATMPPEWLALYLARFAASEADVAVIGGEVIPDWQAPKPDWMTRRMMGILSAASEIGDKPRFIEPPENLFEGNCCYRRQALEQVGGFPVELGRVGDSLLSGEGYVNMLIWKKGGRLYFDPAITIRHTIHADRLNPMWFRRRYFWQGVSGYIAHCYYRKNGMDVVDRLHLALPLQIKDWAFVAQDTAEDIDGNTRKFESLGFVLAMAGIVPVEGAP